MSSGVDIPLVLVAGQGWNNDPETKLIADLRDKQRSEGSVQPRARRTVHRFDYVPFSVLVTLIRGARAVVFPSLYEGFGLPVLESMVLGTPVVTSRESSVPEIAGDAALLVDPYSTDDIAAAIRTIVGRRRSARRIVAPRAGPGREILDRPLPRTARRALSRADLICTLQEGAAKLLDPTPRPHLIGRPAANRLAMEPCPISIVTFGGPGRRSRSPGWVAERLKAPVLKTGRGASSSWVRIPPHPPLTVYFQSFRSVTAILPITVTIL